MLLFLWSKVNSKPIYINIFLFFNTVYRFFSNGKSTFNSELEYVSIHIIRKSNQKLILTRTEYIISNTKYNNTILNLLLSFILSKENILNVFPKR